MEENKEEEEKKICDISELLEKFGKYQMIQYIMVCLPSLFITMISINYVFVVGDVNYRCRVDECEDTNSTWQFPSWWPNTDIDRCSRPVLRSEVQMCTNDSFTGELVVCDSWIYESNNTVIAQLNLACKPWMSNLIGTVHSIGMLLSMVLSGWMADKFGRKPTLVFCLVGGFIGQAKPFATSYLTYIIIEFLEASVTAGTYTSAMVLLLEITGKKHRMLSGIVYAYAVYLGESLFACIAMFVRNWKILVHIINGPCIFFVIFIFLINESPRWQIVAGKVKKAKKTMKFIAKINNIHINKEELDSLDEVRLKENFNIGQHEVKEGFKEMFKSKEILKRLLVAGVCRLTSSLVYYGLMINSVWLPGYKYVNFLLSTVMSFPGQMLSLYVTNKMGRKIPLMAGYGICGVLCVLSAITPDSLLWAKLTLFLIGKAMISACFTGAIVFSLELFPTSVRGSMLGLCAFAARAGGMLAPLTPVMNTVSEVLPFIFFGCSAVLSSLLLILTPETKNLPLFDTIHQLEVYNNTVKENTVNKSEYINDNTESIA